MSLQNKNLGEESSKYWHVILNKTYEFERLKNIADHVKMLGKSQVLRFFDKYVAANAPCRRKLCIQVVAKQHEEAVAKEDNVEVSKVVRIENPADFKRSMPLFAMRTKVDIEVMELGIKKE
jgi:secreted Zn-dependent insulinase-like peptidase